MSEELVVNFIQPGRTITHTYKLSEVFQKQERRNLEIIVKLVVKADSHSMNEIYKPNLSQQATLTILGGKGGKEGVNKSKSYKLKGKISKHYGSNHCPNHSS